MGEEKKIEEEEEEEEGRPGLPADWNMLTPADLS